MKKPFQSRLPPQLTLPQITRLSHQSQLSFIEIEQWYERFILCYPYGYVSFEDFRIFLKQLYIYNGYEQQQQQLSIVVIKQLFCTLNINNDKQLNFEEFFRFNVLINQESDESKLKFILNLYDRQKKNYYHPHEIVNMLINMFGLLNITRPISDLTRTIETILTHLHLNNRTMKICWNTFSTSILNQPSLFELLLTNNFDDETSITRL